MQVVSVRACATYPHTHIPAYPGVSPPRAVEPGHLQKAGDAGLREGREREVERARRLQATRIQVPHARHLQGDAGVLAGGRGVIRGDVQGHGGHGDGRRGEARGPGGGGFVVLVRLLVRCSDLGHLQHGEGRGVAGVKMLRSAGEAGEGVGGAPPEAL